MIKPRTNQGGFGAVEGMLIALVLVALGFVSWHVLKTKSPSANNQASSAASIAANKVSTSSTAAPSDEKSLIVGSNKVFYVPPSGWKVTETKSSQQTLISFTSPDYKVMSSPGMECSTESGKIIYLEVDGPSDSNVTYLDKVLNPAAGSTEATFTKNAEQTTLAGQKAVQYLHTPGECGYSVNTDVSLGKYIFSVGSAQDESVTTAPYLKEPYKSVYENLLSSIRIE